MQITIKSTRIIKEGEQKKSGQPYKWCSVMADDGSEKGTEYTTFDAGVLKQNPGAVIEIGDPQTKEGKLSFKEVVSVISEGKASVPPKPNGDMSKGDWERKQRIERASFEAQTAAKVILAMDPDLLDERAKAVREKALAWCEAKIDANMNGSALQDIKTRLAPGDKTEGEEELWPKFDNAGEFFTACLKKGISRPEAMKKLGLREGDDLSKLDLAQAWETVNEKEPTPTS